MEHYDILREDGSVSGNIMSNEQTHINGLLHRVVHIWVVNSNNEVLMQRRSLNKVINSNMLDFSAGGHVLADEDSITATIRKCKSELNLDINEEELHLICSTQIALNVTDPRKPGIHNHWIDSYVLFKDLNTTELILDPDEVSDVIFLNYEDLEKRIENNDPEIGEHDQEYKVLFEYIRNNK